MSLSEWRGDVAPIQTTTRSDLFPRVRTRQINPVYSSLVAPAKAGGQGRGHNIGRPLFKPGASSGCPAPRPCENSVSAYLGPVSRHSRGSGNPGFANACPRSPLSRGRRCWMGSRVFSQPVPRARRKDFGYLCAEFTSLDQKHTLSGGLRVKQAIGFFRLVELPLMREQAVDIDLALDAEARAVGLALPREGPGGDDRQLPAQHVGADVDRHIVALTDKTHRAPHLGAAHRGDAALGLARGVEREIGAAMRQILDRADRVVRARVDRLPGTELLGARQPLRADVQGDDAGAHRRGELR